MLPPPVENAQEEMLERERQDSERPLVSIVTATYNSSHLLRFAIKGVLQSTLLDWELIVVGDHCTDDTEQVVAEFDDPRIRFYNLETNSGQQATPNNFGVNKARGRYLCFLNQDDMFLRHHLETMVREMRQRSPDIICARYAVIEPFQSQCPAAELVVNNGGSVFGDSEYHPGRWYIASCWFMLKSTALEVGAWRLENQTIVTPSQEWLFRAFRLGKRIVRSEEISLVALYSGARKGSYRYRPFSEHEHVFGLMAKDDFIEAITASMEVRERELEKTWTRRLRCLYAYILGGALCRLGIHPLAPEMFFRYGGRGGFVRKWKKITSGAAR
jgi:glycosyltransferase involved in cell wall biosynthesis